MSAVDKACPLWIDQVRVARASHSFLLHVSLFKADVSAVAFYKQRLWSQSWITLVLGLCPFLLLSPVLAI